MTASADPAADTLWLPFVQHVLPWPAGGALFLRARGSSASPASAWPGLVCEQSFKPDAARLAAAGYTLATPADLEHQHALVLILPPRQREESRALYARALQLLSPEGRIVACVANNEGARSSEGDLEQLCGSVTSLSKHKCRVFWSAPREAMHVDATLLQHWLTLDAPQPIEQGRYMSRPGLFAWDRIDVASALLAAQLPQDLAGEAADLGAGFGYLADELLRRCPRITELDLYEAEQRALKLAQHNLAPHAARVRLHYHWHDVTTGLEPGARYDVIISNPPFHSQARADRPELGQQFIAAAANALRPGGRLYLVANRHLPYEAALGARFGTVRVLATAQGFKVIEAIRASGKST